MTFGDWLLKEIGWSGHSYRELGRRSGFSQARISQVVNGDSPSADFCIAIAKALDIPPTIVLRRAGKLPPRASVDNEIDELRFYFERLDQRDRQQLIRFVRAMSENDGN